MSDVVNIQKRVEDLNISPEQSGYTKVIMTVGVDNDGNKIVYEAGNESGKTLYLTNPFGTQQMANDILERVRGFQYQPFQAKNAIYDPSAEMGDGVSINGMYSGIYSRETKLGDFFSADISAPHDEEIEAEQGLETATDRQFTRFLSQTKAGISLTSQEIQAEVIRATAAEGNLSTRVTQNATSITSEVTRATAAEGTLSSRITQNASSITAEVSRATTAEGTKLNHTGGNQSFSWSLLPTAFILKNNGTEVFKANSGGIYVKGNGEFTGKITATSGEFTGKITASSGKIGGFNIGASALWNNISSFGGTQTTGVYVGTNGIQLGQGFKVNSSGAVTASNLTLSGGSINLGNGAFKVDSNGKLTASNISVTGGSITGGSININNRFKVDSSGNVSASNLAITGGSISIGSNFSVNASGNVTAKNMNLSGTLTIGGQQISAANLYTGASQAASNYTNWNGTTSTVNSKSGGWDGTKSTVDTNGDNWNTGYSFAYGNANSYANAITQSSPNYPGFFRAGQVVAMTDLVADDALYVGGWSDNKQAAWQSLEVVTNAWLREADDPFRIVDYYGTMHYIPNILGIGKTTETIHYLGR